MVTHGDAEAMLLGLKESVNYLFESSLQEFVDRRKFGFKDSMFCCQHEL